MLYQATELALRYREQYLSLPAAGEMREGRGETTWRESLPIALANCPAQLDPALNQPLAEQQYQLSPTRQRAQGTADGDQDPLVLAKYGAYQVLKLGRGLG